jgi:hypothetical protein
MGFQIDTTSHYSLRNKLLDCSSVAWASTIIMMKFLRLMGVRIQPHIMERLRAPSFWRYLKSKISPPKAQNSQILRVRNKTNNASVNKILCLYGSVFTFRLGKNVSPHFSVQNHHYALRWTARLQLSSSSHQLYFERWHQQQQFVTVSISPVFHHNRNFRRCFDCICRPKMTVFTRRRRSRRHALVMNCHSHAGQV